MFTENPQSRFKKKKNLEKEDSHTITYFILKVTGM